MIYCMFVKTEATFGIQKMSLRGVLEIKSAHSGILTPNQKYIADYPKFFEKLIEEKCLVRFMLTGAMQTIEKLEDLQELWYPDVLNDFINICFFGCGLEPINPVCFNLPLDGCHVIVSDNLDNLKNAKKEFDRIKKEKEIELSKGKLTKNKDGENLLEVIVANNLMSDQEVDDSVISQLKGEVVELKPKAGGATK